MNEAPRLAGRTEVRSFKVEELLDRVRQGVIRIPNFQRPLRWTARDVTDLFDSIVRGYPVGLLLFAQREAPAERLPFGALAIDAPARHDAWYVVDGQQRIVSLAGALLHPDETPHNDIHAIWYDLEAQNFFRLTRAAAPEYAIPLRALGRSGDTLRWLRRWAPGAEREELANHAIDVGQQIREFAISVAIVNGDDDKPLREIFRRVNNLGVAMKQHEVFNALHAPRDADNPAQAVLRLTDTGFGLLPETLFYQCMMSVAGLDPEAAPEDIAFTETAGPTLVAQTETALRSACAFFFEDVEIPHFKLLPYALPLRIAARFFAVHPSPSPRARTLLRRWVWRGTASGAFAHWSFSQVRRMQASIVAGEADRSAGALLADLPTTAVPPDLTRQRWEPSGVPTRLVVLALLRCKPRDPRDGKALSAGALQALLPSGNEQEEDRSLSDIVVDVLGRPFKARGKLSERVVVRDLEALSSLAEAGPTILETHLISPAAAAALAVARRTSSDRSAVALRKFSALRAEAMSLWVERFLAERCEFGANDRPSISTLRDEAIPRQDTA